MKKILASLICLFAVLIIVNQPVFALSQSQLDRFSTNNIMFYDPDGDCGGQTGGKMSGKNNVEKIASYFAGNNSKGIKVKKEAIAGILASVEGESGFNPFRNESDSHVSPDDGASNHGYGIFQFTPRTKITGPLRSDPRTKDIFDQYYKAENSYPVGEGDNWRLKNVPDSANDAFLEVELDFGVENEFKTTKLGGYRNLGGTMGLDYLSSDLTIIDALQQAKNAADAARLFVWIYERPANKPGAASAREKRATDFYLPMVEKMNLGSGNSSSRYINKNVNASDVTIIGDSISYRTKDSKGFEKVFGEEIKDNIDSEVGRQFSTGKEIAKKMKSENKLNKILVFALGTNSSGTTKAQAQEIVDIAGKERTVVFVTNYSIKLIDFTSNNNVFKEMANTNDNVILADWAAAVSSEPTKYIADEGSMDVHPTIPDGTDFFAKTIYDAIVTGGGSNDYKNACGDKGGKLSEGGLTEEQAYIFVQNYGENKNNDSYKHASGWYISGCHNDISRGLGGSNCVTFSEFFINKFTDLTFGMADGHNVVRETLAANPGLESGDEPKVWALFSTIPAGVHTGIVLGIHDGKYYVGQASCSNKGLGKGNGVYDYNKCWFNPDSSCGSGFLVIEENSDTSTWFSSHGGKYTFAYPTNVNTQLIEDYINGKGV